MHATIPINRALPENAALDIVARLNSACSPEADEVGRVAQRLLESKESSFALFGPKADALSGLHEMIEQFRVEGWEGEPVSDGAVRCAEDFIRALPSGCPLPEFAPEPDGDISMDWILARNRMFSISVGDGPRLACAWLNGTDSGHAVAYFDGTCIPRIVLERIGEITSDVSPALRSS